MKLTLPTLAVLLFGIPGAYAAPLLQDNFDSPPSTVLNWPGDSIFQSIPQPGNVDGQPSVDLVGASNIYSITTFSGNSVDLDGSTGSGNNPAGQLTSVMSFAPGNYTVTFELSGNQRHSHEETTVVSI